MCRLISEEVWRDSPCLNGTTITLRSDAVLRLREEWAALCATVREWFALARLVWRTNSTTVIGASAAQAWREHLTIAIIKAMILDRTREMNRDGQYLVINTKYVSI